jgi:Tfp pilus assembly protein PilO
MSLLRRQTLLVVLLLVLSSVAVLWSYAVMADRQRAAQRAARETTLCRQLADRIEQLRHRPSLAGSQELATSELAKLVEQAATASQLSADNLVRIAPEPARRIGEGPYKEKPTQVLLRNVNFRHVLKFLHTLSKPSTGLSVRQIRLTAPREQEAVDRWAVEATLSYLVYAPGSDSTLATDRP